MEKPTSPKLRSGSMALALRYLIRISIICLLCLTVFIEVVHTQGHAIKDPSDKVFEEVGVDEKLDATVLLETSLTDNSGKAVKLGDYFTGEPVILTLNYYECPMLCPMTFTNLIKTINAMTGLSLEKDFRVVTVSFNDRETIETARKKQGDTHMMLEDIADPKKRWPFLIGNTEQIRGLTTSVGYRFKRLDPKDFAHPNVFIILTPEGKISRYLYGLEVSPLDLKLSLLEAADGKIGESPVFNRMMMYCYSYDPVGKKYTLMAVNVMKLSGLAIVIVFGSMLTLLWIRDRRRRDN